MNGKLQTILGIGIGMALIASVEGIHSPEWAEAIGHHTEVEQSIPTNFNGASSSEVAPAVDADSESRSTGWDTSVLWGFGALTTTAILIPHYMRRKRTQTLKQVASSLGMTFLEQDNRLQQEAFFHFDLFQSG